MRDYGTSGDFGEVRFYETATVPPYLESLDQILLAGWHKVNSLYKIERRANVSSSLIIATLSGEGHIWIDQTQYTASPGTIFILPYWSSMAYRSAEDSLWEFCWLHYAGTHADNCTKDIERTGNYFCHAGTNDLARLFGYFETCPYRGVERAFSDAEALTAILHYVLKKNLLHKVGDTKPQMIDDMIAFIEGSEALCLEDLENRYYLSREYLIRMFKKHTGFTPYQYWKTYRLKKTCADLEASDKTLKEIALSFGYKSVGHYISQFKKCMGVTPTQYRKFFRSFLLCTENGSDGLRYGAKECTDKIYIESNEYRQLPGADDDGSKNSIVKEEITMEILSQISENLQKGKSKIVKELVQQALDAGIAAEVILENGLISAMNVVGDKFKNNEIFIPEVLVAARAMNAGAQLLKPHLAASGAVAKGKVCIGTVQGDLHDIGKNLVKMMMEGKGLEVIDLGVDVPAETFVKTAIEQDCQIICCSSLLTTTMGYMEEVVKAVEAAGIRDKVKIMVGGAPVNEEFCQKIGADCYTVDAASAADAAVAFCLA